MNPAERTLQVLEYIMAAGPEPLKQVDIARDCGLSPSTLNRIVASLSDWGYLFRTSEKYVVRNFRLERNVPMSDVYLAKLDETMRALSEKLAVSAEIVVVAGHELLWHSKTDHPDPNVVMRAGVGFRRSLYELDALSKLYLSRIDWKRLQERFFTDGFFETQQQNGKINPVLPVQEVKKQLDEVRQDYFTADATANHVGIRRFATVIEDPDGKFLHLLSLAEPEAEVNGSVKTYKAALLEARKELTELVSAESAANRLRPKYHAMQLRGG